MLVQKCHLNVSLCRHFREKNMSWIFQTWFPSEPIQLSLQFCTRKKMYKGLAKVKKNAFKYGSPIKFPGLQLLFTAEKNKEEK